MGSCWGTSSPWEEPTEETPDYSYTEIKSMMYDNCVVVLFKYDNSLASYGGEKILVLSNEDYMRTKISDRFDPHFSPSRPSPIARFHATAQGWEFANKFAQMV